MIFNSNTNKDDNMALLTVGQYATQHKISEQATYQRIKRGKLSVQEVDGIKMIDTEQEPTPQHSTTQKQSETSELIKFLKQTIKQKNKEIKQLNKLII